MVSTKKGASGKNDQEEDITRNGKMLTKEFA